MPKFSLPIPDEVLSDFPIECSSLDLLTAQHEYPIPEDQFDEDKTGSMNAALLVLSGYHHKFQEATSKIFQGPDKGPWIDSFLQSDLAKDPRMVPTAQALDRLRTGNLAKTQLWAGALVFFWMARHNWSAEICTKLTDGRRDYLDNELHESDWQIQLQSQLVVYTRLLRWRSMMYNQVATLILQEESGQVVTQYAYSEALMRAKYADDNAILYLLRGGSSGITFALYTHVGKLLQAATRNPRSKNSKQVLDGLRLLFDAPCDEALPECMAQYDVASLLRE